MTEANQKRLYEHHKKMAKEGATEKFRLKHAGYAAAILSSFPQFEKPVEAEKPKAPVKETKSKKEK